MTLCRVSLALMVLPGLGLAACGDAGSSSSSGASTSVTATDPTTGPGTTPTTGVSDSTPTATTDVGTVGDSLGATTTTTAATTTTTDATTGTTDATTGAVSVSTTGDTPGTTGTTGTTGDGTTGDTTTGFPCDFGDTMGMGDVEKSYLWVANSDQNTVSKVDTQKLLEVARYRMGPLVDPYGEDPSRTAVSLDGRFMVVNGRASGRTTMIAANLEDCVDTDGDGEIKTSQSKDDILAAVIALRSARTQAMLDAWSRQTTSPVERLSCFADMLIRNRGDIQRFGCPVGTLNAELAKRSHASQADAARLFTLFRDWLRAQFEQLHPPEAAESRALHLLALSQGIAALAQAFRDEDFIRREVALIRDWLRSLASAQGPADCTADDPGALA